MGVNVGVCWHVWGVVIFVCKCRWMDRSGVWCMGVRACVCKEKWKRETRIVGMRLSICRHLISIYHSDKLFTCTGQQQKEGGGVRSMQRLVWSKKGNSPLTLFLCDFPDLRNAKKFAELHAFFVFR